MPPYKSKKRVLERYRIIGFISSGTYGRVYKACPRPPAASKKEYAIKKCAPARRPARNPADARRFKPDKEGEMVQYTGISQSACREMAVGPPPPAHAPR